MFLQYHEAALAYAWAWALAWALLLGRVGGGSLASGPRRVEDHSRGAGAVPVEQFLWELIPHKNNRARSQHVESLHMHHHQ